MKQEYNIKIKLTKEEAEVMSGIDIPLKEWQPFWECFKEYYLLEVKSTLQWMGEEWDELKEDYI